MLDRKRFDAVARYARELHARGWVANHDGNISLRDDDGRFIATPTAYSKRLVEVDDLLVVDRSGKMLRGRRRLFGEWPLHRAAYDARPEVRAVVHAHPPTASGFALAGVELAPIAAPEIAVSLGERIPLVPFAMPGSEPLEHAVADAAERFDAILLERNGVLALGDDLEQALLRLELVEHYARQLLVARQLGGPQPLTVEQLATLQQARTKAGLGPEARGLLRSEGLSARPSAVKGTSTAFTQAARTR
jgi:L-fuculose-phosphate aldolase